MASPSLFSQSDEVLTSETIGKELDQAELRIQTIVDEWKREIKAMQEQINKLEYEIKKNGLIWSDEERQKNESDLEKLTIKKSDYATGKFQPGGEFDKTVKQIQEPVVAKLNDALQKMSDEEKFDLLIRVNM
ncbi:MAG: OmpH family outer membrane protein [Candidatus Kapaibacterium sp.]